MSIEGEGGHQPLKEHVALQAELLLLRDAMENVRHGLCVFDQQGRIAFCNRRYSDAIGLPPEKVTPGLPVRELIQLAFAAGHYSPDRSIDDIEVEFWKNLSCDSDTRGQIERGGRTHVIHPGQTAQGNLVATFEDITAQREAETALRQSETRLSAILDAMPDCVKIFGEDGKLIYINPRGLDLLEAPDLETLTASGHMAVPPEYMSDCIDTHKRVLAGETVVWTYEIVGMRGRRRHVEAHAVPFQAPDGSKAHLSITRDITERRRAGESLRRSEERLQLIQQATGLADFETDAGGVSICSERFFEQCGLPVPPGGVIEYEEWMKAVHPDDRERLNCEVFKALEEQDEFGCEFRIVRQDTGQVRWISSRTLVERDAEGRVLRTIGAHLDITERKEGENALRRSEERLRLIQDASGLGDFENDGGEVSFCSDRFFEQVGLPVGDNTITISRWLDLVHPDDREELRRELEEARRKADIHDAEYRIVRPDNGEVRWISCRTKILRDNEGRPIRTIGAHRDVTHSKKSEIALRESEQRLRLVQEATGLADFWAEADGLAHVSEALVRQLGLPAGTKTLSFDELLHHTHPDDREQVRAEVQASLDGKDGFDCEFRVINGVSGEIRWIHCRTRNERDSSGKPIRSIGAHLDITDRKRVLEDLRESEERFRLAAEAAGLGVWDYDHQTEARQWSDRLREILGVSNDVDPSFQLASERVHPQDRHRFVELLRAASEGGGPVKLEDTFRIIRAADQAERWVSVNCWNTRREDSSSSRIILTMRDVTDERTAEERIRWTATHDPLTKLANRARFQEELDRATRQGEANGTPVGLLLLDLDHFKQINDTLGHDTGDRLLAMFADRLRLAVRRQDIVARLGGDEFAIIMPDLREGQSVEDLSNLIHKRLRDPFIDKGRILDCRTSMGGAIFPLHCTGPEELMKNADIALYAAKAAGRSTTTVFEPDLRKEMQRRTSMVQLARDAIQRDRILAHYQPQFDLRTDEVVGFEALLRWQKPDGSIGLPEDLTAAFEDLDVAEALSERMIEHAISDMRSWLDQGLDFDHVAVNASAAEFRRDNFGERVLERLKWSGIPTSKFQLEVTETVFLGRGAEYVHRALALLSEAGVRIALDDFGTGYASLRHLKEFPVDIIKIDRSFVRDMETDPGDDAIVRAVINLGQSLGITVVAEGIEDEAQAKVLLGQGCSLGQGFLFARAQRPEDVPGLLVSRGRERSAQRVGERLRLVSDRSAAV